MNKMISALKCHSKKRISNPSRILLFFVLCTVSFIFREGLAFSEQKSFNAADYRREGLLFEEKGDWDRAIWNYRKFMDFKKKDPDILARLCKLYLKTGHIDQAMDYAQELIRRAPKSPEGPYCLGMAYQILGQQDKAKKNYQRAVEIDANYAGGYFALGFLEESAGAYARAVERYNKVLEIDPKHVQAFYNLGNSYAALERSQDAIAAYERTVEIDPGFVDAYVNLSILLARNGEYARALGYLDEAMVFGYEPPVEYLESLEPYRETVISKN